MVNPASVGGYIQACKSEADKKDAMSKLNTAYTRAVKAWDAESAEKISDAFDWWNLVFNNKFPSYYY